MRGWLENSEFQQMQNETCLPYFRFCPRICLKELRKLRVGIADLSGPNSDPPCPEYEPGLLHLRPRHSVLAFICSRWSSHSWNLTAPQIVQEFRTFLKPIFCCRTYKNPLLFSVPSQPNSVHVLCLFKIYIIIILPYKNRSSK